MSAPDYDTGLPMPLRRGQLRAVDRIVGAVARLRGTAAPSVRLQYHAATGSGKTLVSRVVIDALGAETAAFGAPRIDLLGQAFQEYRRATRRPLDPIIVCSAPDIREARGFPPGTPVTTSSEELRKHLLTPTPAGSVRVVFFTYQSARRLARALTGLAPLDLLILDEAHRVARPGSAYALVWDAAAIPAKVRLAQTATPRAEMGLAGVYGVVADRYTVGEGIADHVLCDYRVHVLGVDDRATASVLRAERDRRSVAVANALLTAIDDGRMRRVLTFHHRRADAHQFARISRLLATARGIRVPTLMAQSGMDSSIARAQALNRLEASGGIIASPRIYLEGIDVRGVDTVVFVDPKSSEVDISQAVGRAMRINPSDPAKVAQIVIPVAVSEGEGASALLEGSEFKRVWEVLRVLAAQDPRLRDAFEAFRPRAARARLATSEISPALDGHTAGDAAGSRESVDGTGEFTITPLAGPVSEAEALQASQVFLDTHFGVAGEAVAWADAVTLRAVEDIGDQRARDIALLQAFVERTGTTRVAPAFELPDGYALGARVRRLRDDYHAGRLPPEFVEMLERTPRWVEESGPRSPVAVLWPYLLTFEAEHGHAAVPRDTTVEARQADAPGGVLQLGARVEAIRQLRRQGALNPNDALQCEALAGWSWDLSTPTLFAEAVPKLRAFVARYGSARVPAPSDWPGPREARDVIALVSELRLAYVEGRLPTGDERAITREFGLPWARPVIGPALRRRFAADAQVASARERFAAAWGPAAPVPPARRRRGPYSS